MRAKFDQSNLDGCLLQQAVDPVDIMRDFDGLSRKLRDRVNYSPYKICASCVAIGKNVDDMERMIAEKLK